MIRGYQLGISALLVILTFSFLTGCGDQLDTYSRAEMRDALTKLVYPGSKVTNESYIPASVFESLEYYNLEYITHNGVTGSQIFEYAKRYLMNTHQWSKPSIESLGKPYGKPWTFFTFSHKDPKGVYLDGLDIGWIKMKSSHSKIYKTKVILRLYMNSAVVVKKLEHENSPSNKTLFP